MANEILTAFRKAFRDFISDGIPASGANSPKKSEVREVGLVVQQQVDGALAKADDAIAYANETADDLRSEMAGVSASITGAAQGLRTAETWAALNAVPGTAALQPGRVVLTDSGTHTDPVAGGTVPNSGEYRWSTSPAGWRRIGNVQDLNGLAPIISPTFTGAPKGPTPAAGDRSTRLATTATLDEIASEVPLVAERAHVFPDSAGVPLAAVTTDGRVVPYRRSGTKLVCFGDSITEYSDYPTRIAERLGYKSAVNLGFAGERMGQHPDADHDKFSMYQLAAAILANDFSAQATASTNLLASGVDHSAALARLMSLDFNEVGTVTIFYGTNDFGGDLPVGTAADTTGATFRGAMKLSIEKILTAFPHLELVMVTPMWRQRQAAGDGKDATNFPNGLGNYLRDYVDAEIDQANRYQVPVLDFYRRCGINLQNHTRYLDDGLHPRTEPGTELIATRIAAYLNTLTC